MASTWMAQYDGPTLPGRISLLLSRLHKEGFDVAVSVPRGREKGKTIRVSRDGRPRGYVNREVVRKGVLGYAFEAFGGSGDHVPPEMADSAEPAFCDRFGCDQDAVYTYTEKTGKTYLTITDPEVALRALLQDAAAEPAPAPQERIASGPIVLDRMELATIRDLFLSRVPGFVDFRESGSIYRREERDYKVELALRWRESITPDLFAEPLNEERAAGIVAQILRLLTQNLSSIGKPQNMVGWRYLALLREMEPGEKVEFCDGLRELLFGGDRSSQRAGEFVRRMWPLWLRISPDSKPFAQSRLFPSLFLMMMEPKTDVAVRTDLFERVSIRLAGRNVLENAPMSASDYERVLEFSRAVYHELSAWGWRPHDLIDVHSFLWTVSREAYPRSQTEHLQLPA